ncbi:hypothetical protein PPERSA_08743 [Pseudocohnilembus persalinus]|uniref:RRM domain-containing protein n=1 Tax=Pseudocohnilembus persalinus TaxID=266149 RepID=A0A0V0R7I6_PSEPJ|nr:hypothetical protein PPERSA_08743 [Pseudocohnilembus persalinus]|eukprot:KRX10441.1 hypothetical protein PPERSA_08743 [Pseudocohnilembus persalinus]
MVKKAPEQKQEELKQEQKKDRTLFLSGLPYECDEQKIKDFFESVGQPLEIKLPKYQDTGRCRGYAHVSFSTQEEADNGLKLNKSKIGSRYIDISKAKGEKANEKQIDKKDIPEDCTTIFVKNLPYNITEDEVGDFFTEKCGQVTNIRFSYNTTNNNFKGFGYIEFKRPDSVKRAIDLHGKDFQGRPLFIDYEVGQAKQGYKLKQEKEGHTKYNQDGQEFKKQQVKKIKKIEKKTTGLQNFQKQSQSTILSKKPKKINKILKQQKDQEY